MAIVEPMLILICVSAQRTGAETQGKITILTLTLPGHRTSDEHIRTADDLPSSCPLIKATVYTR
jgi:hypothetical protein